MVGADVPFGTERTVQVCGLCTTNGQVSVHAHVVSAVGIFDKAFLVMMCMTVWSGKWNTG